MFPARSSPPTSERTEQFHMTGGCVRQTSSACLQKTIHSRSSKIQARITLFWPTEVVVADSLAVQMLPTCFWDLKSNPDSRSPSKRTRRPAIFRLRQRSRYNRGVASLSCQEWRGCDRVKKLHHNHARSVLSLARGLSKSPFEDSWADQVNSGALKVMRSRYSSAVEYASLHNEELTCLFPCGIALPIRYHGLVLTVRRPVAHLPFSIRYHGLVLTGRRCRFGQEACRRLTDRHSTRIVGHCASWQLPMRGITGERLHFMDHEQFYREVLTKFLSADISLAISRSPKTRVEHTDPSCRVHTQDRGGRRIVVGAWTPSNTGIHRRATALQLKASISSHLSAGCNVFPNFLELSQCWPSLFC
nr:hypothetical protein CFP56_63964 [Quercus suber]